MFYIKVYNEQDMDYSMYSANRYRLARKYYGEEVPQKFTATLVIDDGIDDKLPTCLELKATTYIMNENGKTIETIYTH